ncbi:MAG: hypothetical protein ABJP45_03950 [Cyclobacteriaceae bacterium]
MARSEVLDLVKDLIVANSSYAKHQIRESDELTRFMPSSRKNIFGSQIADEFANVPVNELRSKLFSSIKTVKSLADYVWDKEEPEQEGNMIA